MPAGLKKLVRRRCLRWLCSRGRPTAAILVAGQHPFAASTFEFQQYRDFRGTLLAAALPGACDSRPGTAMAAGWARESTALGDLRATGWP